MWHRSKHTPENRLGPRSTTPHWDRKRKGGFLNFVLKLSLTLGLPILAMWHWGQPAMRLQYRWTGQDHYPVYHWCRYGTIFNGTFETVPPYGLNNCPLFISVPFHPSQLID